MAEMQVVPWVLNAPITFPVAISVMFCPAHVQTQTKPTRGYCIMMASTNGFGMFSSYTLLFPRHGNKNSRAFGMRNRKATASRQMNAFAFVSGVICWGGIFFSCATRSDDVWHDTLELQHVVPIPENVPTFLYGRKVLRASPFKMGWRVSVSCPDRDAWDGSILPCCIHSLQVPPEGEHQRLVVNCRCCSWCAATMQLIGLFLQIQSSWTWVQCTCICVYVFLVPSEAWIIWPFTSYKVKQNDHYHPINGEVASAIFRRHEKLQNTTQQEWNYILYLCIVFPFVSNTLNLRKKTCFLVDL